MQLVLPVSFRKQDNFQSFVSGENEQLVSHIINIINNGDTFNASSQRISVVTGPSGVGKSHLLLASCELASQQSLSHQYLDMAQLINMPTELLSGFINKDIVCIDNLQVIDGNDNWQKAIFDTINQFTENNGRLLLIASQKASSSINFTLPDLKTRLEWGTNFSIQALDDEQKQAALIKHMHALGIRFTDDVIAFLFKRISRNMHELIRTLEILDKASLSEKRKLTVPFVKSTLNL